ncbi:MAG: hypothetical protein GEV07_28760 [Streptosporangiales bacterium]|nr:hypothetical protein [Streptosporangiales bacterium]
MPVQPVVVYPAAMQPAPPQPPPMPPRGQWPMPQPPRQVAPPVPVVDPPKSSEEGSIAERLPLPQLPVAPGPSSKAPVLKTARRIPGDLPLVISPRKGRAWLLFVLSLLVLLAPAAGVAATGRLPLAMLVLVISLAIYIVAFGFRGFAHLGGGPLLGADRHGVWVRSQKVPARAVELPWELIAEIRAKRWFLEQALCVVPRDDRVGRLRGVWGALDQARTSAFFGVPLTASTAFGDKSRDEALRALDELALGRATIVGAQARSYFDLKKSGRGGL